VDDEPGAVDVDSFSYAFMQYHCVCAAFQEAVDDVLHVFYAFHGSDAYAVVHGDDDGSVILSEQAF
jgi:hypothetical protein